MGATEGRFRKLNFTKRVIEALPAPLAGRAVFHDLHTRGLGLLVQPSGHRAFFWFRKVRGRPTWKTLGTFPDLTVEQARARAAALNTSMANWKSRDYEGDDPFTRRHGLTLGSLFEDYLERHLQAQAKNPARAVRAARWQFDAYLNGWRKRKLGSIRRADVRALHHELGEKNGKVTANRVVQTLRTLFNWAQRVELWAGDNPAARIARFPEASRTRFLQPAEAPKLFRALSQETNRDLRDAVLLALFTGARRSNLLAMRWDQLDVARGLWAIPDPKNRTPYVIPLAVEATELLKGRRRFVESSWVFPSTGRTGHLVEIKRGWAQLLKRAKLADLTIHDLRRTLGSWQAAAGVSMPVIGKGLGHQSGEATEIYARLNLDPVRAAIGEAARDMMAAGKVSRRKLLRAAPAKEARS